MSLEILFMQGLALEVYSIRQLSNGARSFENLTEEDHFLTLTTADAEELRLAIKGDAHHWPEPRYAEAVLAAISKWDQQPLVTRALVRQMLREYRARAALATA